MLKTHSPSGLTLIEAVVALVLLSGIVAGILAWQKGRGQTSLDPVAQLQALSLATEQMEKILSRPALMSQLLTEEEKIFPDEDLLTLEKRKAFGKILLKHNPATSLKELEVRLSWQESGRIREISLATLIPAPAAPIPSEP